MSCQTLQGSPAVPVAPQTQWAIPTPKPAWQQQLHPVRMCTGLGVGPSRSICSISPQSPQKWL